MKYLRFRLTLLAILELSVAIITCCVAYALLIGESKFVGGLLFTFLCIFILVAWLYAELINKSIRFANDRIDRLELRCARIVRHCCKDSNWHESEECDDSPWDEG